MTDSAVELILRDIQANAVATRNDIADIKTRLTAIEHHMAGLVTSDLRKGIANAELEVRIERIERRLNLI